MDDRVFQQVVKNFYKQQGRDLPWRTPTLMVNAQGHLDPYAIVVSEIMLQQTQVSRVIPKYQQWLQTWPTTQHLAEAPLAAVLRAWQGLGYNRRAVALHRCAQTIVTDLQGHWPSDKKMLLSLPGIGPYTAAAVQAFAFNDPVVMVETNIRTVYIHHYFNDGVVVSDEELLPIIERTIDTVQPREWYWALMDYGSYLKQQFGNVSRRSTSYVRQSKFVGSRRQIRGAIIRVLTKQAVITQRQLVQELAFEKQQIQLCIQQLEREGLLVRDKQRLRLP